MLMCTPVAIKPSRRLPKAFQRSSSAISRKVARKTRHRKRNVRFHLIKISRQWRRLSRHAHVSFRSLKLWCASLVVAILLLLLFYFLFSSTFVVSSMRVSRQDHRVDIEEIQELLRPFFGRHILFVSPLLLEHTIQSAYPEVSAVHVRRNFPDELVMTLYMDPISAEILIGEPSDTEAEYVQVAESLETEQREVPYAYVTERGIYLEYPFSFPAKQEEERLTIHLVDWAVKPTHRQKILSEDVIRNMVSAKRILRQSFGHSIPFITFYLRAREFHVQTEERVLWFDFSTPIVQQINRYRTFLRAIPQDRAKDYVDLRLHDRVVYR